MAITVNKISDTQRDKILQLPEGHFADLKAKLIKPAKLSESISALANADGGELYVGITELISKGQKSRAWEGFNDIEDANAHIQTFDRLFPLGEYYSYAFLGHENEKGLVLQITINKNPAIIKSTDDSVFVRRGAQNQHCKSPEQLETLKRNKGLISFENELIAVDVPSITNSETVIRFMLEVVPTAEPEAWLKKQKLLTGDRVTVVGVLLFSDLPQADLPKRSGLKIYRYKTDQKAGTREAMAGDPITIEGPTYDVIYDAVKKTEEIINGISVMGPKGLERVTYPTETLHEIITNAILHRDYSIADDVHVRIFDNRVEIESPGKLPAHVTVDNILDERFARNGNLVRLINKFPNPPNKDVGEGLNTAFAAMHKIQLREPEIEEKENSVVVHIKHERLASAEDIIMEYLETHDTITNEIARSLTGIQSENTMKRRFYVLRDAGLIELVSPSKGWKKTDKAIKNQGRKNK